MTSHEWNFDGIVGPTHNYAGLAYGNVASQTNQFATSNPKAAALQGLEKMNYLRSLGFKQAVLPPVPRPRLDILERMGFTGSHQSMVESANRQDKAILAACYSASSMWTANAATVSPSADTADQRVHFTPANLCNSLHRAIEADSTTRILTTIFFDSDRFAVHEPLPFTSMTSDEGAANHTRLCCDYAGPGLELFVFGRNALDGNQPAPRRFPARQTLQASQAVARLHQLDPANTVFVQQSPEVIDQGVFHNDVISVGNRNVLLYHELSFIDSPRVIRHLRDQFEKITDQNLHCIEIASKQLNVEDAVSSYLFNSQLLSRDAGSMMLLCPNEARDNDAARIAIDGIIEADNPIEHVAFLDLRQSMNNGGGPACLRLRVVLNEIESKQMHQGIVLTDQLHRSLVDWIETHYRDQLTATDLCDPGLVHECEAAFSALEEILDLPQGLLSLE